MSRALRRIWMKSAVDSLRSERESPASPRECALMTPPHHTHVGLLVLQRSGVVLQMLRTISYKYTKYNVQYSLTVLPSEVNLSADTLLVQ